LGKFEKDANSSLIPTFPSLSFRKYGNVRVFANFTRKRQKSLNLKVTF